MSGLIRIDNVSDREPSWDKPARIFKDIVDAIHHTYEIRFVTDAADGLHALAVQTDVPRLRVNAPAWVQVGTR